MNILEMDKISSCRMEQPTMNLKFIDGILCQFWTVIDYVDGVPARSSGYWRRIDCEVTEVSHPPVQGPEESNVDDDWADASVTDTEDPLEYTEQEEEINPELTEALESNKPLTAEEAFGDNNE